MTDAKHLNLAVLISGNGSNLQAIIDACSNETFPASVQIVISSTPNAYGLERAKAAGIPFFALDYQAYNSRDDFEYNIQAELEKYDIDLICLAGFMRVLTANFISKWQNKIINTHPSLLPKFGGKGMYGMNVHKAVLAADENISGSTIHYVTPEVDKGEIILQKSIEILSDDTPESLAHRIVQQEHILYPEAILKLAQQK